MATTSSSQENSNSAPKIVNPISTNKDDNGFKKEVYKSPYSAFYTDSDTDSSVINAQNEYNKSNSNLINNNENMYNVGAQSSANPFHHPSNKNLDNQHIQSTNIPNTGTNDNNVPLNTQQINQSAVPLFYNQSPLNNNKLPLFVPYHTQQQIQGQNTYISQKQKAIDPYTGEATSVTNTITSKNEFEVAEETRLRSQFNGIASRYYDQILPEPYKSQFKRFTYLKYGALTIYFIGFLLRGRAQSMAEIDQRRAWRSFGRFFLGYLALNIGIEYISSNLLMKYYTNMFRFMSHQEIQQQLDIYKDSTVKLRY